MEPAWLSLSRNPVQEVDVVVWAPRGPSLRGWSLVPCCRAASTARGSVHPTHLRPPLFYTVQEACLI